ncbi:hypothetical protein [Brucella sp. 10RB9215]|uniref:hypothetical protein n=1 Tax=Brucella sp. 10RB9215 TaxID=1149953 RepID=UPI0010FE623F|nr:hypothetical protein [Brucella sp. 10RB9215]
MAIISRNGVPKSGLSGVRSPAAWVMLAPFARCRGGSRLSVSRKWGNGQGFLILLKIDICGATAEGEGSPRQLPGNFPDNAVADLCFCHKLLISLRINSGKAFDALSRHASQLCWASSFSHMTTRKRP